MRKTENWCLGIPDPKKTFNLVLVSESIKTRYLKTYHEMVLETQA